MNTLNNIQIKALRGGAKGLNNLSIEVDGKIQKINLKENISGQYNIRCIFEKVADKLSYEDAVLGSLLGELYLTNCVIEENSSIVLRSVGSILNEQIELSLNGSYNIGIKVFRDVPINYYAFLDVIPIPVNLVTIYIYFYESNGEELRVVNSIQKHFDTYSHLGFFLADLGAMKKIIEDEYGTKKLDLEFEFVNSEIIDKLFDNEIIMLTWGIHPYTYPIYSTEDIDVIKPLLGKEFSEEGIFNIREDIEELSLIPGYELKNWPAFLEKD